MSRLGNLLSSDARAAILETLWAAESGDIHMRELARRCGFHEATVRQELRNLLRLGLVTERRAGNRAYYGPNAAGPMHDVIRRLLGWDFAPPAPYSTALSGRGFLAAEAAARDADARRRILILAGPNGTGKTTFAHEFLVGEATCPTFVNADYLAAGLSPLRPSAAAALKAGRLMIREIGEHVRRGHSFALETTLSGRRYARMIPRWQARGYGVKLIFLRLLNTDLAIQRVAARVRQGGHDVPPDVIRRRFEAGWWNWESIYRPLVDAWAVYDSSGERPALIEEGERP